MQYIQYKFIIKLEVCINRKLFMQCEQLYIINLQVVFLFTRDLDDTKKKQRKLVAANRFETFQNLYRNKEIYFISTL